MVWAKIPVITRRTLSSLTTDTSTLPLQISRAKISQKEGFIWSAPSEFTGANWGKNPLGVRVTSWCHSLPSNSSSIFVRFSSSTMLPVAIPSVIREHVRTAVSTPARLHRDVLCHQAAFGIKIDSDNVRRHVSRHWQRGLLTELILFDGSFQGRF